MSLAFNTVLGLIAGLIGLVVGLATMLLVWWQAPHQRDNQLMVLYLASVALWGLAGLLLNVAVVVGWAPGRFHQLLVFSIALNSFNTFLLAVRFARLRTTPFVRGLLAFGLICLLIATPLIFSNQVVVLREVTREGLFVYDFVPLGLPLTAMLLLAQLAALGVIWRHRGSPAGQLFGGAVLIVGGSLFSLIPSLGAYAVDVLAAAVASLLFARSILQTQLFGPLTRLNQDLAASNAQLTLLSEGLQATAGELQLARDAAEAASSAKSQFLATMSHELRTPLTSIIGYSDLILLQLEDACAVKAADVAIIGRAGRQLLELINTVLEVATIEAGHGALELSEFAIAPLIDDLVQTIQPLAATGGNTLCVQCDAAVGSVVSDMVKLRQILLNLLGNAVKFTQQGTITLMVQRRAAGGLNLVSFEVRDTGIGMSPEQVARLFEPFMQVDSSNTRRYGGMGMGLALSRRLCHLMGGTITVHSALGLGSTFIVTLPARWQAPERQGGH